MWKDLTQPGTGLGSSPAGSLPLLSFLPFTSPAGAQKRAILPRRVDIQHNSEEILSWRREEGKGKGKRSLAPWRWPTFKFSVALCWKEKDFSSGPGRAGRSKGRRPGVPPPARGHGDSSAPSCSLLGPLLSSPLLHHLLFALPKEN